MPRRPATVDPELRAHQEWLGYLQPVGLVVAPAAMQDAGWVVTRSGSELIERQERYRESLEALDSDQEADPEDRRLGFSRIETLLVEHLGWSPDQIQSNPSQIEAFTRELPELGETLAPSAVVPAASGEGVQLLLMELAAGTTLDQKVTDGEHLWKATPQERFERLLRETGVEAGLLCNGGQLRLVVAPRGESSGHLTFTLADLAEVSGRLMFSGLDLLLGQSHVFLDPDGYRLADVLRKSRSFQAVVSNALADQVLAALWDLLRGFQQADELSQRQNVELLGDVPERDPQQIYGGLITVLMRLVFLLYAEDEALMPSDAVYEQSYKVSGLLEQLQRDSAEYPDTMEQRFGAWAGLMSLCRLVFYGGGPTTVYLPARKGQLFDPHVYPWLETPWISDGVVLSVLSNLLIINGERISYRALDVEQIGSVYEGIMGFEVQRISGRCIGVKSKPQGPKKQFTTVVDLEQLLALDVGIRVRWIENEACCNLPAKAAIDLEKAVEESAILTALEARIDTHLFIGVHSAGSLVLQPTEERRRSGSHYTPRSLTRPIVVEALRPWLERCKGMPTAEEIMALNICDPAMGSGAFLVECCRYLAELLEQAWSREGLPEALQPSGSAHGEEPLIFARRLIAQGCLYGVDKNAFAVNLAKLSLWLISLSKTAPFSFLDHALKCGDSLVGITSKDIINFINEGNALQGSLFDDSRVAADKQVLARRHFETDSRTDDDETRKREELEHQAKGSEVYRKAGDMAVAAFLLHSAIEERKSARRVYSQLLHDSMHSNDAKEQVEELLNILSSKPTKVFPFHWDVEFPEVFHNASPGFNVIVGNPPFIGGTLISGATTKPYERYLKAMVDNYRGRLDICFYFDLRCSELLAPLGVARLVNTSSMAEGQNVQALRTFLPKALLSNKRPWPGDAQLEVVDFHMQKDPVGLSDSSKGYPGPSLPVRTKINPKLCFRGIELRGKGFEVDTLFIETCTRDEPQSLQLIKPYFSGTTLNAWRPGKSNIHCINANNLTRDEIDSHPIVSHRLLETVAPVRDNIKGQLHESCYWRHYDKREREFASISSHQSFFVKARDSDRRCWQLIDVPKDAICNSKVMIYKSENEVFKGILQSILHQVWCELDGSFVGNAFTYNPTLCLDTFPFVAPSPAISEAWKRFNDTRWSLMLNNGLSLSEIAEEINTLNLSSEIVGNYVELCLAVINSYGIAASVYDFIPERIGNGQRLTISSSLKGNIISTLQDLCREYYHHPSRNPAKNYLSGWNADDDQAQGRLC
jgi:hypothetical protein